MFHRPPIVSRNNAVLISIRLMQNLELINFLKSRLQQLSALSLPISLDEILVVAKGHFGHSTSFSI